ncbi:MAG: phosphoribosylanthranilate isomerase [Candidatus Baldrarchaeia archaeon]
MRDCVKVKICGITNHRDAEFVDGRVDYVGFIVSKFKISPRVLTLKEARSLAEDIHYSRRVLVVHGYDSKATLNIASRLEVFEVIQYHHAEKFENLLSLANDLKLIGMKVAPVALWSGNGWISQNPYILAKLPNYEYLLIDAIKTGGQRYEMGLRVPLKVFRKLSACLKKVGAAGGIDPTNVHLVVSTGVYMVDVNSGIERSPGRKDPVKTLKFLEVVRNATIKDNYLGRGS